MRIVIFIFITIFTCNIHASGFSVDAFDVPASSKERLYENPIFLNNGVSSESYNYNLATFKQSVSFNETQVDKLSFNWAVFWGALKVYRLKVNGYANFYYTTFHNEVELSKLLCEKDCVFYFNIFNGLKIYNSSFKNLLSFEGSVFKSIKIENSEFEKTANFSYITVKNNISFNSDFFSQELLLNNARIEGTISFDETVPPPYIDFSEMDLRQNMDLTTMDLSSLAYAVKINLLKTDVNKIKFNYNFFKLYFPPETPINLIQTTYSNLLKKFKNEGDLQSYSLLLAEYSEYMNYYHKDYIKNIISKYWWNYSTNPEWIFFWMGVLIIFYTIINAIFYEKITKRYLDVHFLVESRPATIRDHPFIRFIYFLPRAFLFTIIMFCGTQFRLGITIAAFKTNSVLMNIYFVIIVLSGLVCLFFLVKYILAQLG